MQRYTNKNSRFRGEASEDETPRSLRTPVSLGAAISPGKRRLDIQGNEDQQLKPDGADNYERRRIEYLNSSKHRAGKASQKPKAKPKKIPQDPSVKCQQCFQGHRACDQAKPRCSTCVKRGRICVPQDDQPTSTGHQDPNVNCDRCVRDELKCDQGWPQCGNCQEGQHACEYQEDNSPEPSDEECRDQDPTKKCHQCFKKSYWCDGQTPCGKCIQYKVPLCCPQGSKQKNLKGIPLGDRCWPCRRKHLLCNGAERCDTCIKYDRICHKEKPQPNRNKCLHCEASGYACDGAAPCGTCIRLRKMVCRREDEDERVERHYEIMSISNPVSEDCLGCVRRESVRGAPLEIPCDRQRPCTNCLVSVKEYSCCYQVEPGLKLWVSKKGVVSARWKHKAKASNAVDPGEETSDDDRTSEEDSSAYESEMYENFYEEDQNAAGPSGARYRGVG